MTSLVLFVWEWSRRNGFGALIGFLVGAGIATYLGLAWVVEHGRGTDDGGSSEGGLILALLTLGIGGGAGALIGAALGRISRAFRGDR